MLAEVPAHRCMVSGGTFGNSTGLGSPGECTPVPIHFWAPLGSAVPEPCPPSGFYCPGALKDDLHHGTKPIIMPVGKSTQTVETAVLRKDMTLDISIDDFMLQREALVATLAREYGVDPSLMTLEAAPGSVQLRITIAATNGTGTSIDLDVLEQAVSAVSDATLTTLFGNVVNSSVTVASAPTIRASIDITVPYAIPKGKWATAGQVYGNHAGARTLDCWIRRAPYSPAQRSRPCLDRLPSWHLQPDLCCSECELVSVVPCRDVPTTPRCHQR